MKRESFSPLIFLATLGAGGISVIPFAFLQYTFPHDKRLIQRANINFFLARVSGQLSLLFTKVINPDAHAGLSSSAVAWALPASEPTVIVGTAHATDCVFFIKTQELDSPAMHTGWLRQKLDNLVKKPPCHQHTAEVAEKRLFLTSFVRLFFGNYPINNTLINYKPLSYFDGMHWNCN